MGQMRFLAPRRERVPDGAVERAYMAGAEGTPWRSRGAWRDGHIVIERASDESGNLFIPWQVEGHGELVLSTASLMERERAYLLPLELARGTLNRLRNQVVEWEMSGLAPPHGLAEQLASAMGCFIRAATSQRDAGAAAEQAEQVMRISLDAMKQLAAAYCRQAIEFRHQRHARLPVFLAGDIETQPLGEPMASVFLSAFNWAAVPMAWREVEPREGERQWKTVDQQIRWCCENGLSICGGPLMRLDRMRLPDWVFDFGDEFESLQSHVARHVYDVVLRYRGQVQLWHGAARMNVGGSLPLSEEQKLRLAVVAIEAAHRADPQTPVFISFDQPWCEYLARSDLDLPPLDFADALVRADLGVAGIGLEINLGYWPEGTLPRDVLEISRQIDRWGELGLPLVILLAIPSNDEADPQARHPAKPIRHAVPGGLGPQSQSAMVEQLVSLMLAKPSVSGVIWTQLSDAQPHEFAHAGLFDAQDLPKPMAEVLSSIRRNHLA